MTWLYVPSNYVQDTEDSPSDSETTEYQPWLTLRGTATQRPFSSPAWKRRGWIRLLYGTISAPLTAQRGVDAWISSLPVSPVNHSPQQVADVELTMTDGSGRTSQESSVTWDRPTFSWRTSPDLFGKGSLTSSPTLPASGSMRNGVCSQQPTLEPLTDASEFGSWPTPQAHDAVGFGPSDLHQRATVPLPILSALWITPEDKRPVGGVSRQDQETNWAGFFGENRADLNPRFVAALMGLPVDWLTHSTSEATDWSPK